ncbi:MAG: hypothetical protein R2716_14245 [Microthrixaceae bacterium]
MTDILAELRGVDGRARRCLGRAADAGAVRGTGPRGAVRRPATAGPRALIKILEEEMHDASANSRWRRQRRLRDEIKDLEREMRLRASTPPRSTRPASAPGPRSR